jgi:hypothetical protein
MPAHVELKRENWAEASSQSSKVRLTQQPEQNSHLPGVNIGGLLQVLELVSSNIKAQYRGADSANLFHVFSSSL